MSILMCPPAHYDTEYEINPWMRLEVAVDHQAAWSQWNALRATLTDMGQEVQLAQPAAGLPDMVFTANAGLVWRRRAVISRFRHGERRGEEALWAATLEGQGLEVDSLPDDLPFEGAGDALFVGERLFCGHGFRSVRAAHIQVGRLLDVETVSLELVDPRFYHLDTCFCPLNERTVLFAPAAFSRQSAALIRAMVPHVIEVPPEIAGGFACNALVVGDRVISSEAARQLVSPLRSAGYEAVALPMGEFLKSGGGVRCLCLPLDEGIGLLG
ncbi:MAG: dimethylarginine dimethylaminohydrolase family protein [Candidatus Dormibacteria bacterium]